MADTVTSTLIENGSRNWIYRFTNVSDGTGETAVLKVDPTSNGPLGVNIRGQVFYPGTHIKVREIEYDVKVGTLRMLWGASPSNVDLAPLGGFGTLKFDKMGGLPIPPGVGATGQILFTFNNVTSSASYTVVMRGTKDISQ